MSRTQVSRIPESVSAILAPDGTCAARSPLGFQIPLNGDPVVDAIDDDDSLIYQPDVCDCGNDRFRNNRCTGCGSVAPWAAKLGCGLA